MTLNKNLKFNQTSFFLYIVLAFITLSSCEDVIDIETDLAPTLLVVDGWINDQSETQTITLTNTQPYFDNTLARGTVGATVTVTTSDGEILAFEDQNDGSYSWTPEAGQNIGTVGTTFTLNIDLDGKTYSAVSTLFPAPPIDSITQELRIDEIFGPDGIYAQFFARDLPGLGNAYWIKTFKNDQFLNKPQELNIAFDTGLSPGSELDGLIFLPPTRELVNRLPDNDDSDDNDELAPWAPGDKIRVEIHSISPIAFDFLTVARDQMTNGDNTIFAIPLANTTGNIVSSDPSEDALGIFNVASISSMEQDIE